MRCLIYLSKIYAGLTCIFLQIFFYKKLKISFPSISFAHFPFRLEKGSMTIIGRRAIIGNHAKFITNGILTIGTNFCINSYSRIVTHDKIFIGNNVTIARFVSILDHDHAYSLVEDQLILNGFKTAPIRIGNNVWIGDKVSINKGVKIGNNVIIGANSVVTKDIPNNVIIAGVPAKIIKNLV